MKKFIFKVSFLHKPTEEIKADSNSVITAMNMALNTLSEVDQENVIGIQVSYFGGGLDKYQIFI